MPGIVRHNALDAYYHWTGAHCCATITLVGSPTLDATVPTALSSVASGKAQNEVSYALQLLALPRSKSTCSDYSAAKL